jgi:hypothetical protein
MIHSLESSGRDVAIRIASLAARRHSPPDVSEHPG